MKGLIQYIPNNKTKLIVLVILLLPSLVKAQSNNTAYKVLFYNTENLFDCEDDPLTNDSEFLPTGTRHWTYKRLNNKINRIYKVIMAVGNGKLPAVVGLCEVENQKVLELLLTRTPLEKLGYNIIHKESPDPRGIDVAMLYNKHIFSPISYAAIRISSPNDSLFSTRDILYTKGKIGEDTLHVFVNHWPSKFGGVLESEPNRFFTATVLKQHIDSILALNKSSKIIVMGDFNDNPLDESVLKHLQALPVTSPVVPEKLYNLAYNLASEGEGSHKYQEKWDLIDQIMVSGNLLLSTGLHTTPNGFQVYRNAFLLEPDKKNLGDKPFRTYVGFKYHNGFSDHLPVYLDLFSK